MEYALPIWYTPVKPATPDHRATGSIQHTQELEKVQQLACKLITGTFRTTATDVTELHTHVPPVALHLADSCHQEALHLCTLPKTHPLSGPTLKASQSLPRFHQSPLHMLMPGFNLHPASFETVDKMLQHPNWFSLASTHIAPDKEEAAKCIRTRIDDVQVFSDGSGLDACIGTAAMVAHPHSGPHLQFSLGKITAHTVFESELVGILLAIHLLRRYSCARTALIALDNRAAIAALNNRPSQSGQHIVNAIHDAL